MIRIPTRASDFQQDLKLPSQFKYLKLNQFDDAFEHDMLDGYDIQVAKIHCNAKSNGTGGTDLLNVDPLSTPCLDLLACLHDRLAIATLMVSAVSSRDSWLVFPLIFLKIVLLSQYVYLERSCDFLTMIFC